MARYRVEYSAMGDDVETIESVRKELLEFQRELASIANEMDDRDSSMRALKRQVLECGAELPEIAEELERLSAALKECAATYVDAETKAMDLLRASLSRTNNEVLENTDRSHRGDGGYFTQDVSINKQIQELVTPDQGAALVSAYDTYMKTGETAPLDAMIKLLQESILPRFPGSEGKGVIGIQVEADAAYIIGIAGCNGRFVDRHGNGANLSTASIVVKSNVESNLGARIVVYPYLDDLEKLKGVGVTLGAEATLPLETIGVATEIVNVTPELWNISVQIAPPTPSSPICADAYVVAGYTSELIGGDMTPEEEAKLMERLNNIKGGP